MEIFKLIGSIMVDSKDAENSLSKTEKKAGGLADKLSSGIKTAAKWGAGIVGAATAVGGAMVATAKAAAENADTIDKASQRMRIGAEAYQELAYAAEMSGVEMSTLEAAAKKLEGTDLSFDDAIESIMSLTSEEERAAKAAELFGDGVAYKMTPLLNAGADGLDALRQEAHDLGLVMSGEAVKAGADMDDMFAKVEKSTQALKTQLAQQFMPYVMQILQWVIDNMPTVINTVKSVTDNIIPIVKPVLDGVMALLPPLLEAIKSLLDWITPYITPIVKGVATLVNGILALIHGDLDGFISGVKDALTSLGSALFGIGKDIFTKLWDGLKSAWESISSWVSEKVGWLADKLAFWRSGNNEMADGSHASGLAFVPYDGYKAVLHRGETVLNADNTGSLLDAVRQIAENSIGGGEIVLNITNVLDGNAIGETTYRYSANRAKMFGV